MQRFGYHAKDLIADSISTRNVTLFAAKWLPCAKINFMDILKEVERRHPEHKRGSLAVTGSSTLKQEDVQNIPQFAELE